jgi:hypothetical protein
MLVFLKNAKLKGDEKGVNSYLSVSLKQLTVELGASVDWSRLPRKINVKRRLSSHTNSSKFVSQEIGRINKIFKTNASVSTSSEKLLLSRESTIVLRARQIISSHELDKYLKNNI